ncbi:RNA polymerase sigma factor [Mangrovibacterium lignilyticum]|uniref:RNA polymerase sigma factor n=1 Tax=Mangrovibacterium lignilyticum TaxID=2668052 RepID=UPI0013D878A6|nr:RNA polymerase sigma-70 factor [Mangrovibacterium lignilyticum]
MTTSKPNIAIIRDFKKGDAHAFEYLFNTYHKRLYAFLFSLTHSHSDSEEILQNTFIRIWEKRALFNESYPFDAFLFKVGKNAFLNHSRKKINQRIVENNFELYAELLENNVDDYLMLQETSTIIEALVKAMPPKRQEIFRMQKFDGMSRKEISEKLDISVVTIDSHLSKANKELLEGLKKFSILAITLFVS